MHGAFKRKSDVKLHFFSEDTWSMLDNLGLMSEDIKKKIQQDFIRQMYLVMDAIPATDPPKFKFIWGERAKLEFTKMEILEFAREVSRSI